MPEQLRIKQQNCKHSKEVTLTLINEADPSKWDLLLIQEPYIYPDCRSSIATAKWFPLYPPQSINKIPCSMILVSNTLSSNTFEQIQIPSDTVTATSIKLTDGTINIYNIYNPPDSNSALIDLHEWLITHPTSDTSNMVWAGDFNKHNPIWTAPEYHARCCCSNSELLLQLLADHKMILGLPPGTLTYHSDAHKTWSTLDLVFCDETILS